MRLADARVSQTLPSFIARRSEIKRSVLVLRESTTADEAISLHYILQSRDFKAQVKGFENRSSAI
jgi:hypothetical protein